MLKGFRRLMSYGGCLGQCRKFAGHFDKRGRFLPGAAGPNTAREYSGDNVGNLAVVAKAQDGDRAVEGHGHLIVTVQRWNTPPIY